jgi:putative transposase
MQVVDLSLSGIRVTKELERLPEHLLLPKTIVCENSPEFKGKVMFFWSQTSGVKLHFI